MRRLLMLPLLLLLASLLRYTPAEAVLIDVTGPPSLLGGNAAIVPAPIDARDDVAINTVMLGFNERLNVFLPYDLSVDGGIVPAGTVVDSHMIFLDEGIDVIPPVHNEHSDVLWTFNDPILGVMSDFYGVLETNSTSLLGAAGTIYPSAPFEGRGLETDPSQSQPDSYSVDGNKLTVTMWVTEPGDWIRVVTASTVPEPSTAMLLASGFAGFIIVRRKLRS